MGPLDLLTGPLRSLLGGLGRAEAEVVHFSPLTETRELEARLEDAVAAAHRAADSLEAHVEVIDALARSLPVLTESVTRLTDQIGDLLRITAPLAQAERDVSRMEHFFRRGRHGGAAPPPVEIPPESREPPPGDVSPLG